ncbi:hypothetical protein M758_9G118700 [Ceratodon purpureus]|nr:hypothetical protein M758_9G118700 [Ceratodon purpureus]KAG0606162.1 hypothetical protein M758_9G118700 [Ceratodon purpureus]
MRKRDLCFLFSGGSVTAIEASFMWLGGWRPSCAMMLVYSLMGVQLRDEIRSFGLGTEKLVRSEAVLSDKQIVNLRNVQNRARGEEKKLSKKLASIQMLVSDQDVLAAVMLESSPDRTKRTDLKTVLKPRMSRLKKLLIQADQLRLQTLHQLFSVLSPVQVAHCAIAAFELAFSMHALGLSDDSRSHTSSLVSYAKPLPPRLPTRNPLGHDSLKQAVCVHPDESNLARESANMWCH